ncbi:PAS/PAC sensor hybrid histidine kinase (modular protein) [Candidatus Sulfopaludibacter sp. SbA3]|nr:PAS/PAC sensor hybrid histidine kinase (modular protein) [Candidatus Sulfopaludibacter sp. SbA3]
MQGESVPSGESSRLCRDGTIGYHCFSASPVFDGDRVIAIEGFLIDRTACKRKEDSLRQASEAAARAERYYHLIFNKVSDALMVHKFGEDGLPGKFLDANDNACRQLGYSREELLQMGPLDIDAPEEFGEIAARAEKIHSAGQLIWEGTHVAKDGRRIPVEVNSHLVDLDGSQMIISSVRDITARKDAEKQYRDIFEGALEGIYRTTLEGRNLTANPAMAKMLGYDSAEEVVSTITDTAHQLWADPGDRAEFLRVFERNGVVRDYECRYLRKDGSVIWVSLNSRKVCGEDGRILYSEGFIEDITERKRMEETLRKSEEKFAKGFLSSPAAMVLSDLDADDRLVEVNEAFEQMSGYRREEVIGHTAKELALWVNSGEFDKCMTQVRAGGRLRNFEHHFRRKGGMIGTGLTSSELIELDGKSCAILATIDITEQKNAERAMQILVTAIEHAEEEIVVTDAAGSIQYCNPAFEKVTGYSRGEAFGQNPRMLKSGKQGAEFYQGLWTTITHGKVWRGHLTDRKKDGTTYEAEATISPIPDASGRITGFVAIKRDVTEQLHLEGQLRQAQKLESVGRLAGGVAHDFNNLLTVINGYSDLALRALHDSDPMRSYAEQIRKAGERATGLTKQLLAFSRKQVIQPRVLDMNMTVREAAPMLQRLIGEDIALQTHLGTSLGQVMADPDQIHQVIMNLAVNARDAMPDGGRLDIKTENVDLDEAGSLAIHPAAVPGLYILMTVTDTGHGMDESICKQIFEPFFTTKELGKGTGLGLSTVYGIVRQSGGWIDVWSEVGTGTSFRVYLPRIDELPLPGQSGIGAQTEKGSETILLVEDQEAVRSFTMAALEQFGYHVIDAPSGEAAIAAVERHPGQIHVLLTDVVLTGMNGGELSERLKALRPGLKVLFTSGYTADVVAHRGVFDNVTAYIPKPFSPDELAAKVRELLAG